MNTKLLREVQQHITDEPRRFQMEAWVTESDKSPCGTAACIAGWANILSLVPKDKINISKAQAAHFHNNPEITLRINGAQATRLFWVKGWPKKFKDAYRRSRSAKNKAAAAAARIDYFIRTRGK